MNHMTLEPTRMLVLSLLPFLVIPTHAQKQEKVCQIAARVNGDILTREAYLAVLRDYRRDWSWPMVLRGKSQSEIDAELERSQPSLLDDLIDEQLLAQRGQELGFDADVELKRIDESIAEGYRDDFPQFADELRKQGIDLEQAQASRRREALGQRAIQKEVFEPIFHSITDSERRAFYNSHKEQFMLPATVTLSSVFLPFHGHSESEVARRAVTLLADLRAGADFSKAVAANIPSSQPSFVKAGSLGTLRLDEVKESLAADLAKLSPGEFTQPLQLDSGYQIIRLEARTPATPRPYEDSLTQAAASRFITMERAAGIRKSYIARLREKAKIEVCPVR